MSMQAVKKATQEFIKVGATQFNIGDRIVVHFKIVEGATERIQLYEGIVISKRGSGISASFTVRKISSGVGVERIFPTHSPRIEKIEILRHGKVRRAKLYYMRDRIGKASMKVKEKRVTAESGKKAAKAVQAEKAPDVAAPEASQAPET